MFLLLLLVLQTAPLPCTYVDVHGHKQDCVVKTRCPKGQHQHPKEDVFPYYDKDHKSNPVLKHGDDKCYYDYNDKIAGSMQ